jgi:DNA-binding response OmpR family regulator
VPRILIVDDDPALRAAMRAVLERAGHEVDEAASAYEALRAVLRRRPDMAIIDIVLPDHSGIDVTRAIHGVAGTERLPIVSITADRAGVERFQPESFGAECLLVKPFRDEELLAAVARCLGGGSSE